MSPDEAVRAYKSLAQVERALRTLKSVDLQVRPIHHWLAPRARAQVFLCMLAYDVEWHMRERLKPILFDDHDREAADAERLSAVAPAGLSPAARRKRARRRSDHGLPLVSFRDLMRHLATMTLNSVAAPINKRYTFSMVSTPTALQRKAFELLAIKPLGVQ